MKCGDCKFWVEWEQKDGNYAESSFGECRRNPPSVRMEEGKGWKGKWLSTHRKGWCGEFIDKSDVPF